MSFPDGFVWGAATAAYQVEGAARTDGRGPSIWDTFSGTPGKVHAGHTGEFAADHYRRFREDVAMMADLGLTGYRFSIAWPRIQPGGTGPANQAGLDFYARLIDALLEHGIEPWPTLYHWDLPQSLEDSGGWPARDTAYRFADYAALVAGALGDRVSRWTTLNEPWCSAFLGYASGEHAPGRADGEAAVRAAHHLLLGHGLAAAQLPGAGLTLNLYPVHGEPDAARRVDGLQNRLFLDPVLRGGYPADVLADLAAVTDFRHVRDGDLAVIGTPIGFLGVNYYTAHTVSSGTPDAAIAASGVPSSGAAAFPGQPVRFGSRGLPVTDMGWEIDPGGLAEVLTRLHKEYPAVPLYVTENGAAFADEVAASGVHDDDRIAYLAGHLSACQQAIEAGVDLRGYFAWSLMDNFEWSFGYSKRFGLVYVDYASQRRIPKDSARWYAAVIRSRGVMAG